MKQTLLFGRDYMNRYVVREQTWESSGFNAGSKARNDVDQIAVDSGFIPLEIKVKEGDSTNGSLFQSIALHLDNADMLNKALKSLPAGSIVLFQFPMRTHTLMLGSVLKRARHRKIRTIALVHDLDTIRLSKYYRKDIKKSIRIKYEEVLSLKQFDYIVVHNDEMKKKVSAVMNIPEKKLKTIDIFDYLIPEYETKKEETERIRSVMIAGNLDKEKCGYIYKLPSSPLFDLYGKFYAGDYAENVRYQGAYPPEDLPFHLKGQFGLVWDGEETDTCSGIFGEYLMYNNPHKTSLYLACGIPVIVWKKAAIAKYVTDHQCGIVIDSINDISAAVSKISEEEYNELKRNAEITGKQLREGKNTKRVLSICCE